MKQKYMKRLFKAVLFKLLRDGGYFLLNTIHRNNKWVRLKLLYIIINKEPLLFPYQYCWHVDIPNSNCLTYKYISIGILEKNRSTHYNPSRYILHLLLFPHIINKQYTDPVIIITRNFFLIRTHYLLFIWRSITFISIFLIASAIVLV